MADPLGPRRVELDELGENPRHLLDAPDRGRGQEVPVGIEDVQSGKGEQRAVCGQAARGDRRGNAAFIGKGLVEEPVGVRPADEEANVALRRADDRRIVENARECTTLESGRRSSGLCAGEADEDLLLPGAGPLEGGRQLGQAGVLPLDVLG